MLALVGRTCQFLFLRTVVGVVDRVSRLPPSGVQPEIERRLRENLALKAQVRAVVLELKRQCGPRTKVSLSTRAAQVFAYDLTRGDKAFQNYYLSASKPTARRWPAFFRQSPWRRRRNRRGGRPPVAQEVQALIVTLKADNPLWGPRRIKDELRRLGIPVSEPTI